MRTWTMRAVSATMALSLGASSVWALDSCGGGCPIPPSNSRYVSTVAPAPAPPFPAPVLAATLKKGKKKRVVVVEAMISTGLFAPGAPTALAMMPDVNGILMEPLPTPIVEDCGGFIPQPATGACTLTGTFWLDIDANPGLINVPITVTLSGGEFGVPVGAAIIATMSVRLEKK